MSDGGINSTTHSRLTWIYENPIRDHDSVRACIDWLKVRVWLARTTNFQTVRRVLDLKWVDGDDAGDGGAATEFTFRLHDVARWGWVKGRLDLLEREFGFRRPPELVGLEVAIDFAQGDDWAHLVGIICYCYSFVQFRPSSENYRAFYHSGDALDVPESRSLLSDWVRSGLCTLYAGSHEVDEVAYRLYVKVTDQKENLPCHMRRARMEVTLTGAAMPFRTLSEAEQYPLELLAPYFRFMKPKSELTPKQRIMASALVRFARAPVVQRRGGGGKRAKYSYARANQELNARIYDALRSATQRARAGRWSKGAAKNPEMSGLEAVV